LREYIQTYREPRGVVMTGEDTRVDTQAREANTTVLVDGNELAIVGFNEKFRIHRIKRTDPKPALYP
jgi:hypothetical protein